MLRSLFKLAPKPIPAASSSLLTIRALTQPPLEQPTLTPAEQPTQPLLVKPYEPPRSAPIAIPGHELDQSIHSDKHHKRKRFSYDENHTASLGLYASTETLENCQDDPYSLLELSEENIIEHARRRVELFFYILVAYYQSGLTPEHGHVALQYGRGRNSHLGINITQACHSSLFGSLNDANQSQSRLTGTHILHSLNSTVELPAFVNKLDDELENDYHCREDGLVIIKKVSLGQLNPIEGLAEFFKMMQQAFENIRNNVVMRKNSQPYMRRLSAEAPPLLKHQLLQLVEQGTFAKKWDDINQFPEQAYIDLLLRLTPEEKFACLSSQKARNKIHSEKIKALQVELLQPEELNQPSPSSSRSPSPSQ